MIPISPKLAKFVAEHGLTVGKALLKVAICIGLLLGAYFYGKKECQLEYKEKEVAAATAAAKEVKKETQERVPVIEKASAEDAALKNNLNKGLEKLDEAIKRAGRKPSCDLTDDELRALSEIGNA